MSDTTPRSIAQIVHSNPYFTESRLRSLYSDFAKLKDLNPDGYQANIHAWTSLIEDLIKNNASYSKVFVSAFHPSLAHELSIPPHGKPKSLGLVFEELVNENILIPYSRYKSETRSFHDLINPTSSIGQLISPSYWVSKGLSSIGFSTTSFRASDSKGELVDEKYISWEQLTKYAGIYFDYIEKEIEDSGNPSSALYNSHTLYSFLHSKDITLTEKDVELFVTYWSRDIKKCAVRTDSEGYTYIKFGSTEISDQDIGVIQLKASINNLNRRNIELEAKILEVENNMKGVLSLKRKDEQKSRLGHLLRIKRVLSKSLDGSLSSYSELSSILLKIEDSKFNKDVYTQLVSSSAILKDLNSKINLDDIADIKSEIEEEMEKADEISSALEIGNSVDESELDEELEKLYKEEVTEKKENKSSKLDDELLERLGNLNVNETDPSPIEEDAESKKIAALEGL
ncbi:Snf7-domain-containing protein [Scheffersomyces xylosifermentans]|uniref:Snf7-domain-containing protein n=1 Tax=Scheffersomyces xylosifermentans TaxID=1304137 RepID=UPI00315DA55D